MIQKVKPSTLADTTITSGTYGGSTQQAVFTVDGQGRLTSAGNTSPSVANTQITGLITNDQIVSIANTKIDGVITVAQMETIPITAITGLTGEIKMWPTVSAPTGYLLCNGAAVSRTTYASLFNIIGTTYGAGDNSTTFNLPDFRDRMPIGAGTSFPVANTGGSKDAIVVSHTHTASTTTNLTGRFHTILSGSPSGVFTSGGTYSGTGGDPQTNGRVDMNVNHAHTIGTTGDSGTNKNLPPYLGIYFIIRHV